MCELFFDEEPIYEISKPYLKFGMDGRADRKAQSNMPLQLFQSWGDNNKEKSCHDRKQYKQNMKDDVGCL